MVEFVNKDTGNPMYVAEDRVEEYKAMGHVLKAPKPSKKPQRKKPVKEG